MTFDFRSGVAILSLAAFVQGLTGFGFGLVSMALLPLVWPLPLASLIVVVFNIPVPLLTFWANRRHYHWRDGLGLVVGTACGVPIGVYLLVAAPPELLLRSLGAVMIAFALYELIVARGGNDEGNGLPGAAGFPLGLVSGVLGGAFNVGGPPAIAYAYSRPWCKEQVVAVLQVTFVLAAALRLLLSGVNGWFTAQVWTLSAWAAIPVSLCLLIGTRLFRRVPQQPLRQGVFLFLGVMGCKYMLWP